MNSSCGLARVSLNKLTAEKTQGGINYTRSNKSKTKKKRLKDFFFTSITCSSVTDSASQWYTNQHTEHSDFALINRYWERWQEILLKPEINARACVIKTTLGTIFNPSPVGLHLYMTSWSQSSFYLVLIRAIAFTWGRTKHLLPQ